MKNITLPKKNMKTTSRDKEKLLRQLRPKTVIDKINDEETEREKRKKTEMKITPTSSSRASRRRKFPIRRN